MVDWKSEWRAVTALGGPRGECRGASGRGGLLRIEREREEGL